MCGGNSWGGNKVIGSEDGCLEATLLLNGAMEFGFRLEFGLWPF